MPAIQLTFQYPLNTSVQVGDTAYFSNPIPLGINGNPLGGQWTSTATPHVTGDIQDVVSLGKILSITPWNGYRSYITCVMDQILFNKYYASLVSGGCEIDLNNMTGTGPCFNNFTPIYAHPIGLVYEVYGNLVDAANSLHWFFDNPTVDVNSVMFHIRQPLSWVGFQNTVGYPTSPPWCLVQPGLKNVNGIDDWDPDTSYVNMWASASQFQLSLAHGPEYNDDIQNTSYYQVGVEAVINHIKQIHPNAPFNVGMTWLEFNEAQETTDFYSNIMVHVDPYLPEGSLVGNEVCTQGSYIMFSKDNKANMSSLLGYYASVEFRNSSQVKSELFNVGADFFESSK